MDGGCGARHSRVAMADIIAVMVMGRITPDDAPSINAIAHELSIV